MAFIEAATFRKSFESPPACQGNSPRFGGPENWTLRFPPAVRTASVTHLIISCTSSRSGDADGAMRRSHFRGWPFARGEEATGEPPRSLFRPARKKALTRTRRRYDPGRFRGTMGLSEGGWVLTTVPVPRSPRARAPRTPARLLARDTDSRFPTKWGIASSKSRFPPDASFRTNSRRHETSSRSIRRSSNHYY